MDIAYIIVYLQIMSIFVTASGLMILYEKIKELEIKWTKKELERKIQNTILSKEK